MKKINKNIVQNILNEKYFNSCVKIKVKDISKTVDNKYLIKSDLYDEKNPDRIYCEIYDELDLDF